MPVAFNAWSALLNNFALERAAFTGLDMGWLHSLREIPGFLAFTVVFLLLILKEQTFAVAALAGNGDWCCADWFFSFHYWAVLHNHIDVHWVSLF